MSAAIRRNMLAGLEELAGCHFGAARVQDRAAAQAA